MKYKHGQELFANCDSYDAEDLYQDQVSEEDSNMWIDDNHTTATCSCRKCKCSQCDVDLFPGIGFVCSKNGEWVDYCCVCFEEHYILCKLGG